MKMYLKTISGEIIEIFTDHLNKGENMFGLKHIIILIISLILVIGLFLLSKKLKFILWIVVAVVTVIAIGIFGTGFIKSKTVDTVHPIVTFDIENYGKIK